MGKSKGIKNTAVHIWSNEEKEYLAEITPGHHYTEIQELMKNKFKLEFTMNQIWSLLSKDITSMECSTKRKIAIQFILLQK